MNYEYSNLLNNLSWKQVAQAIVNTVAQLPNIDIAILHFSELKYNTEQFFFSETLAPQIAQLSEDTLKSTVIPHSQLLIEELIVVHQYQVGSWCGQLANYQACVSINIDSTISILLFSHPNLLASINLHRLQGFDCWQEQEIAAVKKMASQASLFISQMLLGEKFQELAQRQTTINRITATIRSSLEPPVMFAAIARELGEALQVDGCTLSLWTKNDRFVKCVGLYNPHEVQKIIPDSPDWQQATSSVVPIGENPILQALLYTKKTVRSTDLEKQRNLARYELAWHSKARALLIVPLIVEDEIIGSITLRQSGMPRNWTQSEVELAESVAEQAAIAISQVLIHQQVKELAQRQTTINRITATIRSSLEPPVMFAAIARELGEALQVDGCTLSLWTKNDRFVKCVGLYNPHEVQKIIPDSPDWQQATSSVVPIGENPILQALLYTKKTVRSTDLEKQRNLARYELAWHSKARALLIVPLIVEEEIIGSITLRQSGMPRNWTKSEVELAESVASQAAIAVQQAKLYATTKKQAQLLYKKEQKVRELNTYLTESILKRFLPATIVNKAARGELSLDLTPEPRRITVLFCDLVGFTNLSSRLEVELLAEILNEYLEAMSKAVFDLGGTVDKFMGDGVMAMFGAPEPLSCPKQAKKAIATARTMHYYLEKLNERWQTKASKINQQIPPLQMRCGIHQGKAVVGMFGGGQRKDYTAVGTVVNIASRLQSVAQPNTVLISETVANRLTNVNWGEPETFQLKGIEPEFRAFTLRMSLIKSAKEYWRHQAAVSKNKVTS
ncbi:adenylyl/guanylyl cyclase [Chondrocystis sp. NIES-4102]|nr:adenylyl/guanylyl cyclase [Chondrocystis sp. NIES-4102]